MPQWWGALTPGTTAFYSRRLNSKGPLDVLETASPGFGNRLTMPSAFG